MSDFKPNNLKKVQNLLIVVSTHGEGDPPDNALSFHEFLHGKRAPKLDNLRFSVLALGDSSYEFFCQTGKEFDATTWRNLVVHGFIRALIATLIMMSRQLNGLKESLTA